MDADENPLASAIRAGNIEEVRRLLDSGADAKYRSPHGYGAVLDAVFARDGSQIIPLLGLLLDRGANPNGVSNYGESALGVLSRDGRWDALQFLLDRGADPSPLQWTPLMTAIALGSFEQMQQLLGSGAGSSTRDGCQRTPWLLCVQTGDVQKAQLLLQAGANIADRGRCDKPAIFYAVEAGNADMLRWLLSLGLSTEDRDQFRGTALIEAAEEGQTECVRVLLEHGADVHPKLHGHAAIGQATNLDIVRLLQSRGEDLNYISNEMRRALVKLPARGEIDCTRDEYLAAKHQRFGAANPQKMNEPFWHAMMRSGKCAYEARKNFGDTSGGPAVWCYTRFGKSITELPDGRTIEIAGEHEDFYDPDFCIYNDVFVHDGEGHCDIYIYPQAVFPPTDFHTATLAADFIYIIGRIGYMGERHAGETLVYRLSIHSFTIDKVETTGQGPGWIGEHTAKLVNGHSIQITGGKRYVEKDGTADFEELTGSWMLDLPSLSWEQR